MNWEASCAGSLWRERGENPRWRGSWWRAGGARELWDGLVSLCFPPGELCEICGRPVRASFLREYHGACDRCLARIPYVVPPFCERCGKPLRLVEGEKAICWDCEAGGRFFRIARSVGIYDGVLREHLHALKYRGQMRIAGPLGSLMAERAKAEPAMAGAELILPVPLTPARLEERGFNQALLLARHAGRRLGLPVYEGTLLRKGVQLTQTALSREERRANVRGAFYVVRPGDIAGKNLILVDDVFTTGATADECARALLRSGARRVDVLTVAVGVLIEPT